MTYVEITADYSDPATADQMDGISVGYQGRRSERKARAKDTFVWEFENPHQARQFGALMALGGAVAGIKYHTTD